MLIGFAGKARSGKNTAGNICSLNIKVDHSLYAFADPIKKTVNELFGWNDDHADGHLKEVIDPKWGFSPRKAYQLFGTEFGRNLHDNLWIKFASNKLRENNGNLIVTDVRFNNEAEWIRNNNGVLVYIIGPEGVGIESDHVSEKGFDMKHVNYTIQNTGTFEDLEEELMRYLA